jgi:hypothetical protein
MAILMADPVPPLPSRPWRDIARELAKESDRNKISVLSRELNRALEEQTGAKSAPTWNVDRAS